MARTLKDRTLALAGIFQAAYLVRETADRGKEITPAVESSLHSIFTLDANSVDDVYGGATGVQQGLQILQAQLANDRGRDMELTRYVVAILVLERKLNRRPAMLQQLHEGIAGAADQAAYFSETHANVIARLADLYQQTVSTLTPRIMVTGEPNVLSNPGNAALIRALLLAGIRSAVLWRQCGGSRFQLLFRRGALAQTAGELAYRSAQAPAGGGNRLH